MQVQSNTNPLQPKRALWIEISEVLGVAFFFFLLVLRVLDLRRYLGEDYAWLMVALSLVVGYLSADLFSGFVHWFCDRFFEEDTPVIGPMIIFPFREHHRDPERMTHHGFFELNGNNCLALVPFLGLFINEDVWFSGGFLIFWKAWLISVCLWIFLTNQLHAWAHTAHPPQLILWLQKKRIFLSPKAHATHHSGDHSRGFCVTSGWMNPVMDHFRLFRACEHILVALGIPRTRAEN